MVRYLLILSCLVVGGSLPALEAVPRGVFGIPSPEQEEGRDRVFGGAAVLIDTDGHALTLSEAIPEPDAERVTVVLPGGRRREATIVGRDPESTAVLLRIPIDDIDVEPLPIADSDRIAIGTTVWSVGNPFQALETDDRPALSRGIISGRYEIGAHSPVVRGRAGRVLTRYHGPVLETTAAINDGNQGGALIDDSGALVGLASLGVSYQRRVGTAVPIRNLLAALELDPPLREPAGYSDPVTASLARMAPRVAESTVLIYFQRPHGPGNPPGMPRPLPITEDTPAYLREQLQKQWDRFFHQQQIFFTDQPVCAVVIDAEAGWLITATSNLHGGAHTGTLVGADAGGADTAPVTVYVKNVDQLRGLAVLKATAPLELPALTLAKQPDLHTGDPLAVIGRHRNGGPFTMTTGVVSTPARQQPVAKDEVRHFGQTDALCNYGNLGGPVIDLEGRLVGMSVLLAPQPFPWGTNSGVALFLDSGQIREALPDLQKPRVECGIITNRHLIVTYIYPGSAADLADLRLGDRVLAVNGERPDAPDKLSALLADFEVGQQVTLLIRRDGLEIEIDLALKEF